jgi:hypothetical protein
MLKKPNEISFTNKQIELNKKYKPLPIKKKQVKSRQIFKCSIDGYFLRIGRHKVTKTWAIKFAKWILKSFENYD